MTASRSHTGLVEAGTSEYDLRTICVGLTHEAGFARWTEPRVHKLNCLELLSETSLFPYFAILARSFGYFMRVIGLESISHAIASTFL